MNAAPPPAPLRALVDRLAARRLVVAGDLIADEFIYGEIARVSREAPVLILNYDSTEVVPGGAGNAAANAAALGARVAFVGLIGRDAAGDRVADSLARRGVPARGLLRPAHYATPTKTRILAGGVHSAKQQVVRIDRAAPAAVPDDVRSQFEARVVRAAAAADALLISDYGTGLVRPALVTAIRRMTGKSFPILVDSRYSLMRFRGMTACTPNESEVEHALGVKIGEQVKTLERAGAALLERTRAEAVLITRGSRGMALFTRTSKPVHIPIVGSDQIADVTGAGDTVIATMTLALSAGATLLEAAHLANHAGGLVVMKRGTATVSSAELREAVN